MTVEEVVKIAQKHGLICEDRNGIPMLINPDMTEAEFHAFFKEIGWERSYGCVGNLGKEKENGRPGKRNKRTP